MHFRRRFGTRYCIKNTQRRLSAEVPLSVIILIRKVGFFLNLRVSWAGEITERNKRIILNKSDY